jgi:nitrate reductase NapAB chaperone NapD
VSAATMVVSMDMVAGGAEKAATVKAASRVVEVVDVAATVVVGKVVVAMEADSYRTWLHN